MSNAEIVPKIIDYMKKAGHINPVTSINSSQLAAQMGVESKYVSWALAAQFRHGESLFRRERPPKGGGKGWKFWVATRKAKVAPAHRKGNGKEEPPISTEGGASIGIYFCREGAEDLMLTFDEARLLYSQLTVVFG